MHLGHARRWDTTEVHPGEAQAPAVDMVNAVGIVEVVVNSTGGYVSPRSIKHIMMDGCSPAEGASVRRAKTQLRNGER